MAAQFALTLCNNVIIDLQSQTSSFKTPMSFKPDSKHKPSPSRKDLWKAELGLDGELK